MASSRRSWGTVRKMRSGAYQASYVALDGVRYYAPHTYRAKVDAEGWLSRERKLIELGEWRPPADRAAALVAATTTVRDYSTTWIAERDLAPKTRWLYQHALDSRILPAIGSERLQDVTPALVRTWWAGLGTETPTANSHSYRLLKAIFNTALADGLVSVNPVQVAGAGRLSQRRDLDVLSAVELDQLVEDMPVEYQAAALVLAWCGLRFGELIELRRKDIGRDAKGAPAVVRVRRSATKVGNKIVVGAPKSEAGVRDVTIPPHVAPALADHLRTRTANGPEAFVFTTRRGGGRLTQRAFTLAFKKAAEGIGHPGLRVHDLRHVGATLAAQAGATTRELMDRLGHSTPAMSMRYQHSAAGRDSVIAQRLSEIARGEDR
ncbi:site-specific integrase [uncultured Gordonia sp.]|uniref:tyrosine-type recombinase/integrase n=1 Tax=uncultured Gordonia sp. TaxID=198437 RepID=UPI00258B72EA|nr:site-specific integrase [uncultured Gordonia sp.]